MSGSSRRKYTLDIAGKTYELTEAGLTGVLFDVVTALVFEKHAHRVTYLLQGAEMDLSGSGAGAVTPLATNLYRHLKEQRCSAPLQTGLEGDAQSFRLHSVVDALVAVAFYRGAGEFVPHLIVDDELGNELLRVLDRGQRAWLTVEDPQLRARLSRLVPGANED